MSKQLPKTLLEWKESVGGFSAGQIQRAIHYHFHPLRDVDPWYKERGLTVDLVRRNAVRMCESVPDDYVTKEHPWYPKYPQPASRFCKICQGKADIYTDCECKHYPPADPNCKECCKIGFLEFRVPGTLYSEFIDCTCRGGPGRAGVRKRLAEYEAALAAKGVTA